MTNYDKEKGSSFIMYHLDVKNLYGQIETILKSQERFKSEAHNVYTKDINNIALKSNDDKRLQTFDRITLYSYGKNAEKVCKTELLNRCV